MRFRAGVLGLALGMSAACGGGADESELPRFAEVTAHVDADGRSIRLVNADPIHTDFVSWMLARFDSAGLPPPRVGVIWFPPAPDCSGRSGLATVADERFGAESSAVVCFDDQHLTSNTSESGWAPTAIAFGIHELAHLWMVEQLDDRQRAAFNTEAGLSDWAGEDTDWAERGVEHAAFTIAWGLAGADDARYPIRVPPPSCDELTRRFTLLTGAAPLTGCSDDYGRP